MFASEVFSDFACQHRSTRSLGAKGEVSGRGVVSTVRVIGQRGRRLFGDAKRRSDRIRAASPSIVAAPLEVEDQPRQSRDELPSSWDASELDDSAIERELRKLRTNENVPAHKLRHQPVLVHQIRSRALRRKRSHLRRQASASGDSLPFDVKYGERLTLEQQRSLCECFKEWHRVIEVRSEITQQSDEASSREEQPESWASAAGLSQAQLEEVLKTGPLAARALLTSAEYLLRQFAQNCLRGGGELEDVMAEAREVWLLAALKCDFTRASLSTLGTMMVRQRLYRIVDEQQSLLQKPPVAIYGTVAIKRAEGELTEELGRPPTADEIADRTNMDPITVNNLLTTYSRTLSIDTPSSTSDRGEEQTIGESIPSAQSTTGRDQNIVQAVKLELDARMRDVVHSVTDATDQRMLLMRYGFEGEDFQTLQAIGNEFKMTREAVRKRLEKSLFRLRKDSRLRDQLQTYIDDGSLAESLEQQ